jgi:hypothetical protein
MTGLPAFPAPIEYDDIHDRVTELWQLIVAADRTASTEPAFARRDALIEVFCLVTGEGVDTVGEELDGLRRAAHDRDRRRETARRMGEEAEEARVEAAQFAHDEMIDSALPWVSA